VRLEKVRVPRTVEQALLERYCGGGTAGGSAASASASSAAVALLPTASGRRLVEVELVGEARVRERLANTRLLTSARLVDAGIGRALEGEEQQEEDGEGGASASSSAALIDARQRLAALAPNVAELDLSDNLLSDWSQVRALCRALPALRVLDLSGNRVRLPQQAVASSSAPPLPPPPPAPRPPLQLRTLVLNDCAATVTWPALVQLVGSCLPELEALHACRCGMRSLALEEEEEEDRAAAANDADGPVPPEPAPLPPGALSTLRTLDLEGNDLSSWREVERLRLLPRLERLQLSGNPLRRVWCRRPAPPAAAASTPTPPPPFAHLSALTIGNCGLSSWGDVDALAALLPRLAELRLSGNPVLDEAPAGGRYEAVARLSCCPRLALLNGAAVRQRERRDSELRYVHGLLADAQEAAGAAGVAALVAMATAEGAAAGVGGGSQGEQSAAEVAAARLSRQNPQLLPLLRQYLAEAETLDAAGAAGAAGGGGGLGGSALFAGLGSSDASALAAAAAAADAAGGVGGAQGALAALAALASGSSAAAAAGVDAAAAPLRPAAAAASTARQAAVIVGSSAAARRAGGGGGGTTLAASALDVMAAPVVVVGGGSSSSTSGAAPPPPRCPVPPSTTMGSVASLLRRMMAAERAADGALEARVDESTDQRAGVVRVALVAAAASAADAPALPPPSAWEEADEDARLGDIVAGLPGGPYAAGGWVVAVQVA
jgi:hypothetical protein